MEGEKSEINAGIGSDFGVKAKIWLNPSLRLEFKEIQARFEAAIEMRDGLQELFSKCNAWIKEQNDFENDEFKKAMVLNFLNLLNEKLQEIMEIIKEIEPKIKMMLAAIRFIKEVPHHG